MACDGAGGMTDGQECLVLSQAWSAVLGTHCEQLSIAHYSIAKGYDALFWSLSISACVQGDNIYMKKDTRDSGGGDRKSNNSKDSLNYVVS